MAQACRLLEQDAPLTLEALAGQLAMSPFHFHRLFKSVTGMTLKPGNKRGGRSACGKRWSRGYR